MQQVAKRYRLHRTTLSNHLRLASVSIRRRGIPSKRLCDVIKLYKEGWSCQQLADRCERNDETVWQTIKRAGVHIRKRLQR